MKISDLSDKEFKVMVIKELTELGRRMDEPSENFKKRQKMLYKKVPNISHINEEYNN